jgi:hypothetical protein
MPPPTLANLTRHFSVEATTRPVGGDVESALSCVAGAKGRYKIAVKVIDIFGNDTTKVVEVNVG